MPTTTRRKKTARQPISRGRATGRYVQVNTDHLRFVIEMSGMTHAKIARRAGVSTATVSNLVATGSRGGSSTRTTCRPETAKEISEALGLKDSSKIFEVVWTRPE